MSTMAENVIAAGAENCPPMLERSQYNSWQSMLLYIRGKDHGIHLLDSVKNRTFNFGIVEVRATPNIPALTRDRTLDDLTPKEKIHEACDIRITNIILQGLAPDIYILVNHHTVLKEICDKVKLLNEGSKLSLQEQEPKFVNKFDRLTSEKGETIHSYYLRVKLLEDVLSRTQEMLMQINQGSFDVTTVELEFLADLRERVDSGLDAQALTNTTIFQIDDIDAFDSDFDEISTARAVFMANHSTYDQMFSLRAYSFQDIMYTAMHSDDALVKYVDTENSYIDEYSRCLELEAELSKKKDMAEKDVHN
nr:hypothetical protein [Tanacetum cinerariifolium]